MRKEDYHSNRNVFYACKYHVVWCPKYRRKVLTPPVDARLKQIIEEVCLERRTTILALEILPDHVHLFLDMDPQFGIHRLVRLLKGRSSRLLRQEFPTLKSRLPTLWTNSYLVMTTGSLDQKLMQTYMELAKGF